jgi:hypothetical protein
MCHVYVFKSTSSCHIDNNIKKKNKLIEVEIHHPPQKGRQYWSVAPHRPTFARVESSTPAHLN